jgi:hypothetical protein
MQRQVNVNDTMQHGYMYYRTVPIGRDFAPQFRPELTPKQMLELGVFGGKYMTGVKRCCTGHMTVVRCDANPELWNFGTLEPWNSGTVEL